jgi:diguanylate cyclase (GGDEF)-like protein
LKWLEQLGDLWSTTRFRAQGLSAYAETLMLEETRKGLKAMSLLFLALLLGSALFHSELGLGRTYVYTAMSLAALCTHVYFSSRAIREIRTLHVLGMTLLIISGTAFVLVAHQQGAFGAALFTSVALLFMVIPMVPWGLREASTVTLLIYAVFSSSTWAVKGRFDSETLWTLQAFMLAAGMVSLTLVARGASVRKEEIQSRYDLESAHTEMERLSYQDPLTGTWNRRFLDAEFRGFAERVGKAQGACVFAILDVDRFKQQNDGFGHAHGDQVLRWVGRAFSTHLGDAGCVVRAGGDEFILLMDAQDPEALIEQALSSIHARAAAEGPAAAPEISLSVGLVEIPPDAHVSLDDVFMVADGALYQAKRAGTADSGPLHLARVVLNTGASMSPERRAGT